MIVEILEQMLAAAIDEAFVLSHVHSGEPSRFVIYDPRTGVTLAAFVTDGQLIRIPRDHRLLVEPIDRVPLRTLVDMTTSWRTT